MVKYQTLTDEGGEWVSQTKFERTIMEYQTFFCQGEGVANSYWSDPFSCEYKICNISVNFYFKGRGKQ